MQKLIPDTNFLIYLVKYKLLDDVSSYELVLLKPVLKELVVLSKHEDIKQEDKIAAYIALDYIKKFKNKKIISCEGRADDIILEYAQKHKILVGTMDKNLTKELIKKNIKVLIIKQKKYLKER